MKMKGALIAVIILAAAVGIFAIAADYGTQSDPLVSLSYITDVLTPDLVKQAEKIAEDTAKQVNSNITSYEARVDKKVNEFIDRNTANVNSTMIDQIADKVELPASKQAAPFTTLQLTAGKTVVLTKGCEVLARGEGSSCKAGKLIDMTTGGLVSAGGAISANHLYVAPESVTISVKSTVTVLVKGQYSSY